MASSGDHVDFLAEYIRRSNLHEIESWAELVAEDATYWFSTGSHRGKDAIVAAVAHNFSAIEDEVYAIGEVEWLAETADVAAVRYRFSWTGRQGGVEIAGSGRGTNVLIRRDGRWLVLHEHLST